MLKISFEYKIVSDIYILKLVTEIRKIFKTKIGHYLFGRKTWKW